MKNNLLEQITELLEENEELRKEIKRLETKQDELKSEIKLWQKLIKATFKKIGCWEGRD